jgi:glycosyltransferase involved in cell wall biosynthesis
MRKRICIVTTRHVSYNPRAVKEADALSEAGYKVTVIAVNNHAAQDKEDECLILSRKWRLETVNYRRSGIRERFLWLLTGCRKRIFDTILSRITLGYGVAERAQGREYSELCRLARRYPADLYIVHHVEALGAAYRAAKKYRALFAFDSEDFHSGESDADCRSGRLERIEYLEAKYLPRCNYVTASSEGIAGALSEKYGVACPEVILNVFPLEPHGNLNEIHQNRIMKEPSLYWYSQVIGPGRGLDEVIRALSIVGRSVQLHLRGAPMNGFNQQLKEMAASMGLQDRLYFHPPASPADLIRLAELHDIGLSIEPGKDPNNLLAASNKLFSYMVAGLAIIATDTLGQKHIMSRVPDAGIVCRKADAASLAEAIDLLISDPSRLARAKRASREAAVHLFNWETEKKKLLKIVENCMN